MIPARSRRLARILAPICGGLAILVPLVALWSAVEDGGSGAGLAAALAPLPPETVVSSDEYWCAVLIAMAPLVVAVSTLLAARRLFEAYAWSDWPGVGRSLASVGRRVLVLAALGIAVPMLQGLVVTWDNPVGARQLRLSVDSSVLGLALAGGLIAVVGDGLRAARTELEGFV